MLPYISNRKTMSSMAMGLLLHQRFTRRFNQSESRDW
jgi:hypothetical protein